MEPELEDEEAGSEQPAEEEPERAGAIVQVAGHEVAASATTLDASGWGVTAARIQEVAGALPKLLCLRVLVLDGLPLSGTTRKRGEFRYGVETLDADLDMFRALCEGLRACQGLTSLSLKKCYLGPQALAVLADLIRAMAVLMGPSAMPELSKLVRDATAAVKKVTLSGNALTGGEPGYNPQTDAYDIQTDGKDISGVSVLFPSMTQVTELDVSDCGLGPTSMPELAKLVAALTRVSVLSNPIGADGAGALIEVFNQNTNLRTLLGIEEGVTELNLSEKNVDPGQAKILAAELKANRAVAVVTDVNVSGNPLTGGDVYPIGVRDGKDISGVSILFPAMTKIITLNVSNCGLGPTAMPELSKLVRDASAVLASLNLSGNSLTGATARHGDAATFGWENVDSEMAGFIALCVVLGRLTEVNLSDCRLGPTSTAELAKVFSDVDAVLARVSVLSNPIGTDGADALIQVFEQNTKLRTLLGIEEGVNELNLSEKNVDPGQAKILAAELKASRATAALASLTLAGNPLTGAIYKDYRWQNIDSDMAGFVALCAVLGKLNDVDLSDCHLGPASTGELAKVFSDARAVVTSDNRSSNAAGGSRTQPVTPKHYGICCCSNPGRETRTCSKRHIGVPGVTSLAKATSAGAVLKKVALSGNPLTGGDPGYNRQTEAYDIQTDGKDLSGVSVLFASMIQVTELNMSNCGLGPTSMPELAKLVSDARAALTSVNCLKNPLGDEGLATLVTAVEASSVGSICGLTEGQTAVDWSQQKLGPFDCKIIAAEFGFRRFSAVLTEVNASGNPLTGGYVYSSGKIDKGDDISGVSILFPAMTKIVTLNISNCGLGPRAMVELSKLLRDASAAVTSLAVHSNQIGGRIGKLASGATPVDSPQVGSVILAEEDEEDVFYEIIAIEDGMLRLKQSTNGKVLDEEIPLGELESDELSVYTANDFSIVHPFGDFCNSLKTSQVTSLNLSKCGLGSDDLTELAEYVRDATAVLEAVNLAFNKIGAEGGAALVEALKTSNVKFLGVGKQFSTGDGSLITRSHVRTGVTLTLATRVAEVTKLHPNPEMIELTWQDDGSKNDVYINSLDGEPLNLPLQSKFEGECLDVSHQQIDPGSAVILAWWLATPFSATIKSLAVAKANFGLVYETGDHASFWIGDGYYTQDQSRFTFISQKCGIVEVWQDGALQGSGTFEGATFTGEIFGGTYSATVNDGVLLWSDGDKWSRVADFDRTTPCAFESLCNSLATSKVTDVDFSDCGLSPLALQILSDYVRQATAVINSLAVGSNPIGDEAMVQLLDGLKDASLTSLDISKTKSGVSTATKLAELLAQETAFKAAIEKVNVSGCNVTQEAAAQLLTAANEASRTRLRAHQVLAFSTVLHDRLGSECLLQSMALDTDVWRRVAENIRERHGHELMCSQLAQAGQTWFEVIVEGLIAEGISR